jgi:uncharacterized protein YjbJ (UPF0337 family)
MINNADVLATQWKALRGKIKQQWSAITDGDLAKINGQANVLVDVVQERYNRVRLDAEMEVERFLRTQAAVAAGARPEQAGAKP